MADGTLRTEAGVVLVEDLTGAGRMALPPGVRAVGQGRWLLLAILCAAAALQPLRSVWIVDATLIVVALVAPGVVALSALGVPSITVRAHPIYLPAASVLLLTLCGLLDNWVGPLVGIARPLVGPTPGITLFVVTLSLWCISLRHPYGDTIVARVKPPGGGVLVPLVLAAISAIGALRLNNGHGSAIAEVALVLAPTTMLVCTLSARRLTNAQACVVIFSCALAAEWAYSLRSQGIVGFDISTELNLAEHVANAGVWHAQRGNAYAAMLSLTVLPATLTRVTGISPLLLFKVVYPVFTACLPVSVFLVARHFLPRGWALGAASLLVVQTSFFQQLPEVARQEVGLLFFAVLVAALQDRTLSRSHRATFVFAWMTGLVLSHYSTAYVGIFGFALSCLFASLLARRGAGRGMLVRMLFATVLLLVGTALWYGPVTHSSQNAFGLVRTVDSNGLDLLPSTGGGIVNRILNADVTPTVSAQRYQRLAAESYKARSGYIHALPEASEPKYDLASATAVPAPPTRSPHVATVFRLLSTFTSELLLLLALIGTGLALRSRRRTIREAGIIASGAIGLLILFRFSGTLSDYYSPTRLLLQGLVVLAGPAAYAGREIARRARRLSFPIAAGLTVLVAVLFYYDNGATGLVTGGSAVLSIDNYGEDYERVYTFPAEMAAARWASAGSGGSLLYADNYGALRVATVSGKAILSQVTPQTLDAHAWVYATHTNVVLGSARGATNGVRATYAWPASFLNTYYDVMFDDGYSKVYHR